MLQERVVPGCQVAPHSKVRHAAQWRDDIRTADARPLPGRDHAQPLLLLRTFASFGRRAGLAPRWTSVAFEQAHPEHVALGRQRSPANGYSAAKL